MGDETTARNVTFVEYPALEGSHRAFYNIGSSDLESFEGIRYMALGPPDLEPVTIVLNDPMWVDHVVP